MHFRVRGNHVQIVKTQPGEAGGKAKSRPVGSANLATGEIRARGDGALTAQETEEVKAWLARHTAIETQKRELEFKLLPQTLASVSGWLASADAKLVGDYADEVRRALQQMRRALDRASGGDAKATRKAGRGNAQ